MPGGEGNYCQELVTARTLDKASDLNKLTY
jgi:hypothetical protein